MKVFHGPANIAGIAGVLAKAERLLGAEALSYCLPTGYLEYQTDRVIKATSNQGRIIELFSFMLKTGWRFDIFHFYFGYSLTLDNLSDVPWLKRLGKKIFFYFHGCDIRDSKAIIKKYQFSACKDHWPTACSANRRKAIEFATRYANGIFVSTPDLLEFIPGSVWLPQPIDMAHFRPLRDQALAAAAHQQRDSRNIVIAHAPSNRMIKGTVYLEQAIKDLQMSGYPVELLLIENTPYKEALALCAGADLVVDQLLVGAYGQFTVEMMALGKPVICYIRDDVRRYYPDNLPIIPASPETICSVIESLLSQRKAWDKIGQQAIQYVNQVHDSLIIARQTLQYYQQE